MRLVASAAGTSATNASRQACMFGYQIVRMPPCSATTASSRICAGERVASTMISTCMRRPRGSARSVVEVGRAVPFAELLGRLAEGTVDAPPALHGRALRDLVGPAHDVPVLVQREELRRAVDLPLSHHAVP